MTLTNIHSIGLNSSLSADFDLGKALRFLLNMAFVNERPELGWDPRWIDSGDTLLRSETLLRLCCDNCPPPIFCATSVRETLTVFPLPF
jgi:hypothetical protein